MGSIMGQGKQSLDRYASKRHLRAADKNPTDHRWHAVLSYHMAGYSVQEISELTGYATPSIYKILSDDRVRGIRQQLLASLDDEFEAQYRDVLNIVKELLASSDPDIKLKAVDMWMKAHGKYKQAGSAGQTNVTAENVVMQIMNGGLPPALGAK